MPETLTAVAATVGHVAVALPDTRVPSGDVAARLGVEPGWIEARTGIEERRVVAPGETLTGLAARAGAAALAGAGVAPEAVDLVLVATTTADDILPNAAPLVAAEIGARRAGAIDVGAACTGFLSGLALAAAQVEAGRADLVLLIGADVLSRYVDPTDRGTSALFGDGAGAVLVGAARDGGGASRVGPVVLGADGAQAELLRIGRERALIEMQGPEVFRHAVARMGEATLAACEASATPLEEIDLFVYHQANARILRAVGQRLGLDPDRVVDCIGSHGNTSAASIPIALDAARREGRLPDGARVLISAFGAGFTWGGVVVEWGAAA
jgi:3-oxoacyl-[acyl-carrier-protein] synthase III